MHTVLLMQDKIGLQKYGVPVGGPMDAEAAKLANWLVGNKEESPLLEITMQGPTIEFSGSCQIALTGASANATIDSVPIYENETLTIAKSEVLTIGKLTNGSRAYLAVRGDWRHQDQKTSFKNHVLKKEDEITIKATARPIKQRTSTWNDTINGALVVRAVPGPEWNELLETAREAILATTFTLLPESNRMGYRLSPNLPDVITSIISSGVIPGVLQITPQGMPILLMQDGPTTGGYVRALTVLSEDLSKLGQLKPGDQFSFSIL